MIVFTMHLNLVGCGQAPWQYCDVPPEIKNIWVERY